MMVDHWMTFGKFAEQDFFRYPNPSTYTGVIINANMLSHAPGGLAGFISGKTRPQFPYIIDPLTHAFQHNPTVLKNVAGSVKSSIVNLITEYGTLITKYAGKSPIIPEYFADKALMRDFVFNCLRFQSEKLYKAIIDCDNFKYMEEAEINKPYALIAPYFYMDEVNIHSWLDVNIELIRVSLEMNQGIKLFGSLILSQGILLENDLIKEIVEKYNALDVQGFLLWIDELDEINSNRKTLNGLLSLAKGLRKNNTLELINLHGGYFSLVTSAPTLKFPSFTGVTHGPEYGEFRKIVPVGGGIPVSKFYIKDLHNRINYKNAAAYFSANGWLETADIYYRNVCDCKECRQVIASNAGNFVKYGESKSKMVQRGFGMVSMEYPLQETKERCLRHYLCNKEEEYNFINSASKSDLMDNLSRGIDKFKNTVASDEMKYLFLWNEILSNL